MILTYKIDIKIALKLTTGRGHKVRSQPAEKQHGILLPLTHPLDPNFFFEQNYQNYLSLQPKTTYQSLILFTTVFKQS